MLFYIKINAWEWLMKRNVGWNGIGIRETETFQLEIVFSSRFNITVFILL